MILGIETSCDETAVALVTEPARCGRTSSPRRQSCTRATAASSRRSPRAGISSSWALCSPRRSTGGDPRRRRGGRGHARARPDRALLVGPSAAKAVAWSRRCRSSRSTTCTARPRCTSSLPLEPPFLCLLASGGHTLLLDVARTRDTRSSARRSTTPRGRPSTRALPARPATRAGPRSTWPRATATPGLRLSGRARARLRLLLLRPEDGAPLRRARPPAGRAGARRRSGGLLPAGDRPRPGRAHTLQPPSWVREDRRGRGVAANSGSAALPRPPSRRSRSVPTTQQ